MAKRNKLKHYDQLRSEAKVIFDQHCDSLKPLLEQFRKDMRDKDFKLSLYTDPDGSFLFKADFTLTRS